MLLVALGAGVGAVEATPAPAAAALKLRVLVHCSLTGPVFSVRRIFEQQHPGLTVLLDFYCSDNVAEKMRQPETRPDVYASIGKVETELAVGYGLAEPKAATPFGRFPVVLTAPRSRLQGVTRLEDLAKPEVKLILLPALEASSLGACAKSALLSLGLWDKVAGKVQYRPTVMECHRGLVEGKADASFAYIGYPISADPAKAEFSKVVAVQTVDDSLFGGALACGTVLKTTALPGEAAEFVRFLATPEVGALLATIGLVPLEAR